MKRHFEIIDLVYETYLFPWRRDENIFKTIQRLDPNLFLKYSDTMIEEEMVQLRKKYERAVQRRNERWKPGT